MVSRKFRTAACLADHYGLSGLPLRISFFLAVALCLPFLFARFAQIKWDRQIGELSYPLYLVHFSLLHLGIALQFRGLWPRNFDWALLVCMLAAFAFWKLVDQRIEKYRARFSASNP